MVVSLALCLCSLSACPAARTPEQRVAEVVALAHQDLGLAAAELATLDDPVLVSAALLAMANDPTIPVMPEQARALCELAPTAGEGRLCWRRFGATHLQDRYPAPRAP